MFVEEAIAEDVLKLDPMAINPNKDIPDLPNLKGELHPVLRVHVIPGVGMAGNLSLCAAVLFDVDGTLTDSDPLHFKA